MKHEVIEPDRTEEIEAAMNAAREELHSAGIWSVNDTQLRLVVCAALAARAEGKGA